jgi:hypothetical protein
VNVFALLSILLYALKKVGPMAFLIGSFLWIVLMFSFWFLLPALVYRRAVTFKHSFSMDFEEDGFTLRHDRGQKNWAWNALSHYVESRTFSGIRLFLLLIKAVAGIRMKCMNCGC